MKKVIFSLLLFSMAMSTFAQYRDVKLPEKPKQTKYVDFEHKETGFWCAVETEVGSSVMQDTPNMQYVNLLFTGGYRFSEFLRVGAGLGGRYYFKHAAFRDTDNEIGIPIYANARGNFISAYDCDGVPFWSINVGGITYEGVFASPMIGYSFGGLRNNFQIGITYTITNFKDYSDKDRVYSYFGVKLGYEF